MRRLFLLAVLVAGCAGAVNVGSAQGISTCGNFFASTTLTADCAAPLVVRSSGITVNLGGHSVFCNGPGIDAIEIPAVITSSTVMNGSVKGGTGTCDNGVDVFGGNNQVISVKVANATVQGFDVTGDSNYFLAITSIFNGNDGFISFGSNNTVRLGQFAFNGDDGASFFLGSGNRITRSRSFDNGDKGIIVGASSTLVDQNQSFFNSIGLYFSDGSTGSVALLNQTYRNNVGIQINATSSSNVVDFNGSYANFIWDMEDDNANCDSNTWFNNLFSTANQSCIS